MFIPDLESSIPDLEFSIPDPGSGYATLNWQNVVAKLLGILFEMFIPDLGSRILIFFSMKWISYPGVKKALIQDP
jgi:hypothetical protein